MITSESTTISDTGYIKICSGDISDRPTNLSPGLIRYNTELRCVEWYNGTRWINPSTGNPPYFKDDLVLHWDFFAATALFDPTTNRVDDLSRNRYAGILVGTNVSINIFSPPTTPGIPALQFNGTDPGTDTGVYIKKLNYVSGASDQINNLTIEVWLRNTSGTAPHGDAEDERIIMSFDRSSVFRLSIGSGSIVGSAGKPAFSFTYTDGGSGEVIVDDYASSYAGNLRDNTWHQLVVTWSTSQIKYYLDGVGIHTTTGSYQPIGSQLDTTETPRYGWVGSGSEATTEGGTATPRSTFYGYISILRMYYRVLTEEQIVANFNAHRDIFGI